MTRTRPLAAFSVLLLLLPLPSTYNPATGGWGLSRGQPPLTAQAWPADQDPGPVCHDWEEPASPLDESFFNIATATEVAECIEAGLDVTRPGFGGDYPLHIAVVDSRDTAVINVLLQAGAEVDARGNRNATPLHAAASRNWNAEIVVRLIAAGADVNARDADGQTPLHMARGNRNPLVARTLLDAGADRTARDDRGSVADPTACDLWNTVVFGRIALPEDIARCLESGAEVNARGEKGDTPLLHAIGGMFDWSFLAQGRVWREDPDAVGLLLEAGAEVNAANEAGETPLYLAALAGNIPLVNILLDAGAEVTPGAESSLPALNGAAWGEHLELVTMLLEAGADVNARPPGAATALHRALEGRMRNLDVLEALLAAGADLDARDGDGNTPLHTGSDLPARGDARERSQIIDTAIVSVLVTAGADVNARNGSGRTPLHVARDAGNAPVADRLIELGADPQAVDDRGRAPGAPFCDWTEWGAFRELTVEDVRSCLEAGGDPNLTVEHGLTPLHVLALGLGVHSVAFATAFIDAGADLEARDQDGRTPLHSAAAAGFSELLRTLLESGADVHARDDRGGTPLHAAVVAGEWSTYPGIVSLLLDAGAEVGARDDQGRTPLHVAVERDNPGVVARLLQHGADPTALDDHGRSADPAICDRWGSAAFFRVADAGLVSWCIETGADVNAVASGRSTRTRAARDERAPLHLAVLHSTDVSVITMLIEAGADPNVRDSRNYAPLHLAAGRPEVAVTTALLEGGADLHARATGFGYEWGWDHTPLHMAAANENPAVAAALLEAGADVADRGWDGATPLHRAAQAGNRSVIALLLDAGADVSARADGGRTPLHEAAQAGNLSVIALLLDAGADVNARADGGRTPLHEAAEFADDPAVIAALAEAGAEVNLWGHNTDLSGWSGNFTPLHIAAFMNANEEIVEIVAALLDAGADVAGADGSGTTALHLAVNAAVVEVLAAAGADIEARNDAGRTPLHVTALRSPTGFFGRYVHSVFTKLLRLGADLAALDDEGRTPLDYARENRALQGLEVVPGSAGTPGGVGWQVPLY